MIRILICDDHDLVREGIRALLEREEGFEVVGECGDGHEAIRLAARLEPDIVLMDLNLPGGIGGLEAAEAILGARRETGVIVLTQYDDREYVRRALRIGARGYLLKTGVSEQLREAVISVHRGKRFLHPAAADEVVELLTSGAGLDEPEAYERLSPRERQVLSLIAEGKTNREIAKYLSISVKTAMTHRAHVMEKLDLHSRTALVKFAIRNKLIRLDDD